MSLSPLPFLAFLASPSDVAASLYSSFPLWEQSKQKKKSASEGAHVAAGLRASPPPARRPKHKIPFQTFSALLARREASHSFKKKKKRKKNHRSTTRKLQQELVTELVRAENPLWL